MVCLGSKGDVEILRCLREFHVNIYQMKVQKILIVRTTKLCDMMKNVRLDFMEIVIKILYQLKVI